MIIQSVEKNLTALNLMSHGNNKMFTQEKIALRNVVAVTDKNPKIEEIFAMVYPLHVPMVNLTLPFLFPCRI